MRQIVLLIFISFGSLAQSSVSLILGGTERTLQQGASRRDLMLHYTSLGVQYGRLLKPSAEVFGGLNFGFDPSSPARFASASAGMRYFLKPISKRLTPFGQFSGELLFDNSYALTNRDADFIGSAGLGIDFKAAAAVSLRGSVTLGLPFFSTGSLSPFTNSGSNVFTGLSLVYHLPAAVKKVEPAFVPVSPAPAMVLAVLPAPVASAPEATVTPAPAAPVATVAPVLDTRAANDSSVVASTPVVAPATVMPTPVVAPATVMPTPVVAPATVMPASSAPVTLAKVVEKAAVDLDSLFNTEIYFKTDKSWVGPESAKNLNRIIKLLAQYPEVKLHLKGHTDYRKSEGYNLKLSWKRVNNVRLYFVQNGVPTERLKVEAFSEEVPASRTDLQLNRRVEIRVSRD